MSFLSLSPGPQVPHDVHVVIEIPTRSEPVKYEIDKKSGTLFVDRFLDTAMFYPCNYGYIPSTLSEDGDPVDVLVMSPSALMSGAVIRVRPIGLLKMEDESGIDSKILAVPIDKICTLYRQVHSVEDVHHSFLSSIVHFFEHYKDLESGKWVKVEGWGNAEEAKQEIINGVNRYLQSEEKTTL